MLKSNPKSLPFFKLDITRRLLEIADVSPKDQNNETWFENSCSEMITSYTASSLSISKWKYIKDHYNFKDRFKKKDFPAKFNPGSR